MSLQLKKNPNAGPHGSPWIAPEGSFTVGTQFIALADGSWFAPPDIDANGNVTLHAPPNGWQVLSPLGKVLTAPINEVSAISFVPVAAKPNNPNAVVPPSWVKGRTFPEAVALGDTWGITADPSTVK